MASQRGDQPTAFDMEIPTLDSARLAPKKQGHVGYERVKPVIRSDQDGGGDLVKRRKMWKVLQFLCCFGLFLVMMSVIAGLAVFMKDRMDRPGKTDDAGRYNTIGSICRRSHNNLKWAKCIFEDPSIICSSSVCHRITWLLEVDEKGVMSFKNETVNVEVAGNQWAHCGESKWCQESKCLNHSRPPWSNPINYKEGAWVPDSQSPCLNFSKTQLGVEVPSITAAASDAWREIRALEECPNNKMCDGNIAAISFRVQIYLCEPEPPTEKIYRYLPCEGSPLKIHKCKDCSGYNPQNEQKAFAAEACVGVLAQNECYSTCGADKKYYIRKNGVPCRTTTGKGYCFKGACYELSR